MFTVVTVNVTGVVEPQVIGTFAGDTLKDTGGVSIIFIF